ncbi:MAG: hypothetical protein KatS3mg071_1626 [Meiothermus sp.]|nr:MAG: hypothetical protein KatS3mg071_1626 [Meiothermus sp.]
MGKYTPWVGAPVGVLKHAYWEEEVRDTDLLFPREALEAPVKGAQEAARLFSSLAKEEFRLPPQAELYEGTLRVPASLEPWLEVLEALGVSEGALYRRADRAAALRRILQGAETLEGLQALEEALVGAGFNPDPDRFLQAIQAALEEKGPLQGWGLVTPTGERLLWWGRRGE